MKKPEFAVKEFEQCERGCYNVEFGPDGRTVIGLNTDDTMALWDAESGKLLLSKPLKPSGPHMDNWMSPAHLQFVANVESQMAIIDATTLATKTTLPFN